MSLSDTPSGPRGGQVLCATCGTPLDRLRAGHVALFDARFHYFCNYAGCRERFLAQAKSRNVDARLNAQELKKVSAPLQAAAGVSVETNLPEPLPLDGSDDLIEPLGTAELPAVERLDPARERTDISFMLVALTLIAGVLAMALEFAQTSRLVLIARVVLVGLSSGALLGRAMTTAPQLAQPHRVAVVIAPALATLIAVWALVFDTITVASRACFLGATVVTVCAVGIWLVGLAEEPLRLGRRWIAERLEEGAQRHLDRAPGGIGTVTVLGPGEPLTVNVGELVPVDMVVVEGEAELSPWAGKRMRRRSGDVVVAGSRVTQGELRGRCTWCGDERALARGLLAADRRTDVHAGLSRLGRSIAERWSVVTGLLAGAIFIVVGGELIEVAMVVVGAYAAMSNIAVGALAACAVAGGTQSALRHGVVYRDARAWERASQVTSAVFCARGTLLRGEPELVEVDVFASRPGAGGTSEEVLALAAGALASERDPVAVALKRVARYRGLSPEPVRNPRHFSGQGVAALVSTGEPLFVGNRALMLEKRVSVAVAEQRLHELESRGRTVLLVAKASRLIGLVAFQDGLRAGARAAVQYLSDCGVEPVLMSPDARETCEALGRALDIDHFRPEIHAGDCAAPVSRLKDAGATVAVLGHSPHDDEALLAADASIVMDAAGRAPDQFAVALVSDDVRDAAMAIALAKSTRAQAMLVLALLVVPAGFGALVVAVGVLPPEYAPLSMLVGAVAAVWHLRGSRSAGAQHR